MLWSEIKLWVLSLYTDLIGRLGVTEKSEDSKEVCWVSGITTVSSLPTKLSKTEDVQPIWVFLTKLQLSSLSFCIVIVIPRFNLLHPKAAINKLNLVFSSHVKK